MPEREKMGSQLEKSLDREKTYSTIRGRDKKDYFWLVSSFFALAESQVLFLPTA